MSRLHIALLLYTVLGLIAWVSLRGDFLLVTLILLIGLALKTWIGYLKMEGTGLRPGEGTASDDGAETESK